MIPITLLHQVSPVILFFQTDVLHICVNLTARSFVYVYRLISLVENFQMCFAIVKTSN